MVIVNSLQEYQYKLSKIEPSFTAEFISRLSQNSKAIEICKKDKNTIGGKYKEDHVFDENQSVKWNREQVNIENEKITILKDEHSRDAQRLLNLMTSDITNSLMKEYGFNSKQVQKIEGKAYSDHHSNIDDYFFYLEDIADFAKEILDLK